MSQQHPQQMAGDGSGKLERLLNFSTTMARSEDLPSGNNSLSLRQLVPVHKSLLEAAAVTTATEQGCEKEIPLGSNNNLHSFLEGCRSDEFDSEKYDKELILCRTILRNIGAEDSKKLLVWQYLLQRYQNSTGDTPADFASFIWFYMILSFYILPQDMGISLLSDELLEVLLEISLEWNAREEAQQQQELSDSKIFLWQELRTKLKTNILWTQKSSPTNQTLPLNSKIVAIIYASRRHFGNPNIVRRFRQLYYEDLSNSLSACFLLANNDEDEKNMDFGGKTRFLSDLSKTLLLPLLEELEKLQQQHQFQSSIHSEGSEQQQHRDYIELVLTQKVFPTLEDLGLLKDSYKDHEIENADSKNSDRQFLLLTATTALCPLIPFYWKSTKGNNPCRVLIWRFLFVCLQEGRRSIVEGRDCDSSKRGGDSGNISFATGAGGVASMLRRRALYLLDVVVVNTTMDSSSSLLSSTIWKDYALCVETFEMEGERHIIDQIWPVLAKLVEEAKRNENKATVGNLIPSFTPKWIELLIGRILSAEQLAVRKLGIFRILQVLGRPVTISSIQQSLEAASSTAAVQEDAVMEDISDSQAKSQQQGKKRQSKQEHSKKQTKKTKKSKGGAKKSGATSLEGVSTEVLLSLLSPQSFLWDILVPAWDSLGGSSVGYTIHLDNPKTGQTPSGSPVEKFTKIDMIPLFRQTIQNYAIFTAASNDPETRSEFWKGLWNHDRLVRHVASKTLLPVYQSVSDLLAVSAKLGEEKTSEDSLIQSIPMDDDDLKAIRYTYVRMFQDNAIILSYRKKFLGILSRMLSKASLPSGVTTPWNPMSVLMLLTLFSSSYFPALESEDGASNWSIEREDMLVMIEIFVHEYESQASTANHLVTVGAALATGFVTGQVIMPSIGPESQSPPQGWNPVDGTSSSDRELGWAVTLFCTLAVSDKIRHTAGELLWPAIHKGLSQSAGVILSKGEHPKVDFVARALLLLENGCKLRQLSGLGNGDLVVNPKTQQIMPPPPNIEQMLQNSIDFIQWHIRMLLATESHSHEEPEGGKKSKRFTGSYALLISQLKILHQSYPSSQAVSTVMNELLQKSTNDLKELLGSPTATTGEGDVKKLLLVSLIYSACTCGAEPDQKDYISVIRLLMNTGLSTAGEGQPSVWVKSSRSIIQYARWAAIMCILPRLIETKMDSASNQTQDELDSLVDDLLKEGVRASSMTPSDAIKPLFDCMILSSRQWMKISTRYNLNQTETLYVETLIEITKTLLSLVKQSTRSRESACMLNDFCALIFQTKLLREEYNRTIEDSKCPTPIRDAFRQLIKIAGRYRPQITRAVLCRITVGWLGDVGSCDRGISAIPYREDIVQLLLFKEGKYDETSSNQSMEELPTTGVTEIPSNTNYHSVTRTFLLVFFGKLQNPENGLNPTVQKELLHPVILELLKQAAPEKQSHPKLVMRGTPTYCIKIRAWQALCILSRFVTEEIAQQVCATVFAAMNELLHNQIRYFLENFTIKCATMHPSIFGEAFLKDICRTDLSLQHISSLMIMGGNFILGKYQLDYFTQNDTDLSRSKRVLAGVIPWLSSTQGFSRAIAQLIVYKLIPRVVSIDSKTTTNADPSVLDNDWYLKSTYHFLDQNREMKRLRNKQTKFFERYDCDSMCTPEGIFSIKIDEAEEADPLHLIDAIKESLRSTYDEAHEADAPSWKHVEDKMVEMSSDDTDEEEESDKNTASTLQRKIIPLDSLNLALEDLREQRLSNARGAHKQNLIVCASLVDKVPNLAGLARTCEIFAAQKLVLPDASVAKLDNFQAISVSAADWIDMEEVKEEALLLWLLQKRAEGYWIVGLEQTSSSIPLHQIEIPAAASNNNKTVLLLGKEKEGIPVRFLQAVDQCVEIPQFGMIRSLNVHVSGAITIWELTRKTRLKVLEEQKKQDGADIVDA